MIENKKKSSFSLIKGCFVRNFEVFLSLNKADMKVKEQDNLKSSFVSKNRYRCW